MSGMSRLDHKIPPPVIGAVVAAAMWGVSAQGPQLPFTATPKLVVIVVLVVAGVAFDVLALVAFRAARTTINPLKPQQASSMVSGGVYRITRNPMYLGMALLLSAWAVYLSALWAFLGPVIFVLYITRVQIKPEECVLEAMFGEEYSAYAARVRRWL
jgi:protein-S-isoprenylcysteine O-methyltransferase Ste14